MRQAIDYFNYLDEPEEIEVEEFDVLGGTRDFIDVFDRLNELLTATWDEMYSHAEKYYEKNGHLNVPREFTVENGLSLGRWIAVQRSIYNGTSYGMLTEERIDKLNKIGMN